jgi:hypothetical protein|tara:strand:- start:1032 stop:1415 length:384 start_codon:yes stop_codon:yes gene_type:complete
MKSFKEHDADLTNETVDFSEAMSLAHRMKMKASFRKNKAKIALGKKKAAKKLASPEKLKSRANKAAREFLIKKMLKGKSKSDLSFAARSGIEKKLANKKGMISKIAKKLLPSIKKKDRAKLKSKGDK